MSNNKKEREIEDIPRNTEAPIESNPFKRDKDLKLVCTEKEIKEISELFQTKQKQDYSRCADLFTEKLREADPNPDKLFFDIGANKGYNIATLLRLWRPELKINEKLYFDTLYSFFKGERTEARDYYLCGACYPCENSDPFPKPFEESEVYGPHIVVAEPTTSNFELLSRTTKKLDLLFTGYVTIIKAAVSHVSGKTHFAKTVAGNEEGKITEASKDTEEVTLMTADQIYSQLKFNRTIDIFQIDTEGNDPLVLKGAKNAIKNSRVVVFEYHEHGAWASTSLKSVVKDFDQVGFDCYLSGKSGLWRLTGCWSDVYEFRDWSNVVCVKRTDIWRHTLESLRVH